jgi:hypothetical protein
VVHRTYRPFRAATVSSITVKRDLSGVISRDVPECGPTVFERIAGILGPQDM